MPSFAPAPPPTAGQRPYVGVPSSRRDSDGELAAVLMMTWALQTGRIPPIYPPERPNRPPEELSEDELIAFWTDDRTATGDLPVSTKISRKW
jgi:hypothetical protein